MPKKKRKHTYSKQTRTWAIVGSSVMAFIGVVCIVAYALLSSLLGRINFLDDNFYDPNADVDLGVEDEGVPNAPVMDDSAYENAKSVLELPLRGNEKGIRNLLLLGIDSRTDSYKGLSDTTIILSINDNTKTIKLISLLRDTWVTLPGRDKDGDGKDDFGKLNSAYAYGRHVLQNKTIAQNFRLKIDDYIGVNFQSLPVLIDAMGGLDIELTAKEITQIPAVGCYTVADNPNFIGMTGTPGVHHLNGYQAMQYARIRKIDSDFKRTERQRKVITLLMEKAKTMNYTQLISMVYKAVSYVDTNFSTDELLDFAGNALKYSSYTIENSYHLPKNGEYQSTSIPGKGNGLLLINNKKVVQDLHNYIYG